MSPPVSPSPIWHRGRAASPSTLGRGRPGPGPTTAPPASVCARGPSASGLGRCRLAVASLILQPLWRHTARVEAPQACGRCRVDSLCQGLSVASSDGASRVPPCRVPGQPPADLQEWSRGRDARTYGDASLLVNHCQAQP